jgi:hypothetical protein
MFKKPFRSKLIKHGWLAAAKEGGNESQSWRRVKDQVKTAISDMILLYKELPQDKRNELFNLYNLNGFFDILLSYEDTTDVVDLDMESYLIEMSISKFQSTYRKQNRNTLILANVINEYLQKTIQICKDIAYKEKLNRIEIIIPREELRYLCSWSEVIDREKGMLENFLIRAMAVYFNKAHLQMSKNKTEICGKCIDEIYGNTFDLRLVLNQTKDKADLIVTHENGREAKQQFIVKSINNDYLLYYGKSANEQMYGIDLRTLD